MRDTAWRIRAAGADVKRALEILGLCGLGAVAVACAACSIHAPSVSRSDLVFGYAMRNEQNGCHRRVTPGFDLRLGGAWSGASLGVTNLLVLEPASGGQSGPASEESGFAAPLGWRIREPDGTERWFGLALADLGMHESGTAFIYHAFVGIDLRTTPLQRGISIGAARMSVLSADPSGSQAYQLRFSSRDPEKGTLVSIDGSGR